MQASNYATQGKDIGVQDTTTPVNSQAIQATADVLAIGKDYLNTRTVKGFEQQERNQYEGYIDFSKEAGLIEEGVRLQGEAKQRTLTAEENARVAEFENMAKMDAEAYAQGIRKRNDYQLSAQRRLRSAIMQRPDLADEFRRVSAREIGTDVSSFALQYYWENLDAAGKALQKKPVSLTDIENQEQMVNAYVQTLPAEQQATYANTTKRQLAIYVASRDLEGASRVLSEWSDKAAGSPVMDDIGKVNSLTASILTDSDTLSKEISILSDAQKRAALFSDPAAADDARQKFVSLRQRLSLSAQQLASYSSSNVFDEKAKVAMQKAEAEIARIDAAFPDLSTKELQDGAAVYISAQMANLGPQVISRARVAGLASPKSSPEATQAGMLVLGLGEKVMNGQAITKVEALQAPLQNYNMLVTGLSTNVADNASDAKKNYAQYAITYISATLPYVTNIAPGPGKPATEVRSINDYINSLDGVMSVNNRNDSFLDGLWNAAAEKGDSRTQDAITGARLKVLDGYARSTFMDISQLHPELAQYLRVKDFSKTAAKQGVLNNSLLVLVGEPDEATQKEINTVINRYRVDPAFANFYKKTKEYYEARGQAISTGSGGGFTRGGN